VVEKLALRTERSRSTSGRDPSSQCGQQRA
jgi:hypothetical protein